MVGASDAERQVGVQGGKGPGLLPGDTCLLNNGTWKCSSDTGRHAPLAASLQTTSSGECCEMPPKVPLPYLTS